MLGCRRMPTAMWDWTRGCSPKYGTEWKSRLRDSPVNSASPANRVCHEASRRETVWRVIREEYSDRKLFLGMALRPQNRARPSSATSAMTWLLRSNPGRLPVTRTQITQSGGAHLIFKHADGVRNSTGTIAPGIDVRGDGGYIVDWSLSGYSVRYDNEIAQWPDWLLPVVQGLTRGNRAAGTVRPGNGSAHASTLPEEENILVERPRRAVPLTAAVAISHAPPRWSDAEEARVRSALSVLLADNREDWLHRGMELHWLGWDERGYALWDEWSRKCLDKYDEDTQRKTWDGFNPFAKPPAVLGRLKAVERILE